MSWLCFATGCRFGWLVSQARSAGRNLITLFFTVNNPREKFSHGGRPTHLACSLVERPAAPRRTAPDAHAHPRVRRCVVGKALKRSTFVCAACEVRAPTRPRGVRGGDRFRASRTAPQRGRKLFTSGNAFCVRIRATAQTFAGVAAPGSCRLRASTTIRTGCRQKKTTAPGGRFRVGPARISCPRRPAFRRSRPVPAARSIRPCWTVRPRTANRRRRHLR